MPKLHFERALTPGGWRSNVRLTLEADRIVAVESDAPTRDGDERHALGLPAVCNLHSHVFQRAMAGLAEARGASADSFWTWREMMYRFALRMTPEDVEAVAEQLFVEMLEAGFGAVAEFHYLHHASNGARYDNPAEMADRIAAAANGVGIGLTLLPVFYAHSGFGGAPPHPGQRRFINDVDSFARLLARCRDGVGKTAVVGVAPHSLRAATPDEIDAIVSLAGTGPIHIHIAEQVREVEECVAWGGARPVRWLLDHAPVDSNWCLVHATHMDSSEIAALAESRAVAGLCPITEANLGDGVFPAPSYLAAGGAFGVGTDSNVEIGLAAELRMLEYSQRLVHRSRNVLALPGASTGRSLFEAVAVGGAQALGRPSGRLAPGAVADILSLHVDSPLLAGRADDALLDTWIFGAGRGLVDCVWSGGARVVSDGRHARREPILARFAAVMRRLLAD